MTDTIAKPDTAEAIPEFPPDFPVSFATFPVGRLEQVWEFLPPEQRARILELADVVRDVKAQLVGLERAIPAEAEAASQERLRQMLQDWDEEDAQLDPVKAEADWEAIKQGLNASRLPEYPIFP